MGGEHAYLPPMCEQYVAPKRKTCFREALENVLDNQYVELSNGAIDVFKVLIDSGMGRV